MSSHFVPPNDLPLPADVQDEISAHEIGNAFQGKHFAGSQSIVLAQSELAPLVIYLGFRCADEERLARGLTGTAFVLLGARSVRGPQGGWLRGSEGAVRSRVLGLTNNSASSIPRGRLWTPDRRRNFSPAQNAYRHWRDHGAEFPHLQNAKQYAEAAHDFLSNPPPTALTKTRPNGDLVVYDPVSETFGVRASTGAPRTMFKPDPARHGYPTNLDYFNAQ